MFPTAARGNSLVKLNARARPRTGDPRLHMRRQRFASNAPPPARSRRRAALRFSATPADRQRRIPRHRGRSPGKLDFGRIDVFSAENEEVLFAIADPKTSASQRPDVTAANLPGAPEVTRHRTLTFTCLNTLCRLKPASAITPELRGGAAASAKPGFTHS